MQESVVRRQVIHVDVVLTRGAGPPEEVAGELERHLRALSYVLDASWSPEVVEHDGDRLLFGVVALLPTAFGGLP